MTVCRVSFVGLTVNGVLQIVPENESFEFLLYLLAFLHVVWSLRVSWSGVATWWCCLLLVNWVSRTSLLSAGCAPTFCLHHIFGWVFFEFLQSFMTRLFPNLLIWLLLFIIGRKSFLFIRLSEVISCLACLFLWFLFWEFYEQAILALLVRFWLSPFPSLGGFSLLVLDLGTPLFSSCLGSLAFITVYSLGVCFWSFRNFWNFLFLHSWSSVTGVISSLFQGEFFSFRHLLSLTVGGALLWCF